MEFLLPQVVWSLNSTAGERLSDLVNIYGGQTAAHILRGQERRSRGDAGNVLLLFNTDTAGVTFHRVLQETITTEYLEFRSSFIPALSKKNRIPHDLRVKRYICFTQ